MGLAGLIGAILVTLGRNGEKAAEARKADRDEGWVCSAVLFS